MYILTINSGSSSIKAKLFESDNEILALLIEKIGEVNAIVTVTQKKSKEQYHSTIASHQEGFKIMEELMDKSNISISKIAHRVVHGGDVFFEPTLINNEVIETIQSISHLAPLHNPSNLLGIEVALTHYPHAQHYAIFDTAFHQSMPPYAYRYAIDSQYYNDDKIRRYGFHGTSHSFVCKAFATLCNKPNPTLITIHLGNGASICAIKKGKSIDTSMGFTPLEGLVMGTRSGDLDPSIALFIAQKHNLSLREVDQIFNKHSGLKGLCGIQDMRQILQATQEGNDEAQLAVDIFCYRIKKYIGAYIAILGKVDGIVFTGGIGQNASAIRKYILTNLEHLNIHIDKDKNSQNATLIHSQGIPLAVIGTNEELEMARLIGNLD